MTPSPPSSAETIAYLKSLQAVRARSELVYAKAKQDALQHFNVDFTKLPDVATFVVALIKRDHDIKNLDQIPPHSRWRHFDVGGKPRVSNLIQSFIAKGIDEQERTRRIVDLMIVSVLLDAGAGNKWAYKEKATGKMFKRSEGLAIASLDMFMDGAFSSDPKNPHQVDVNGLANLTLEKMAVGFQVNEESNALIGLKGRWELLTRLGFALGQHPEFFAAKDGSPSRPGNMFDFFSSRGTRNNSGNTVVSTELLWKVVIEGFAEIWPPSRTSLDGVSLGDVWPCDAIKKAGAAEGSTEHYVAFHKLSQWMTYSLMEPLEKLGRISFEKVELLTGLPEYRNGGLLIDLGFLILKPEDQARGLTNYRHNALKPGQPAVEVVPTFDPSDPVIIEWRAMTVATLDRVAAEVRKLLNYKEMSLAQVLQGGTWEAGREIAEVSRPLTRGPPIAILSDGTLF